MRNLELGSNSVRGKKNRRNMRKFVARNATTAVHANLRLVLRSPGCVMSGETEAAWGVSGEGLWLFVAGDAAGRVEPAIDWLPTPADFEGSMTLEGPLS